MSELETCANPDLEVVKDNKARWNTPDWRRDGFHNLHEIARYMTRIRSDRVLVLDKNINQNIADLPEVISLTSTEIFSGMCIVKGQTVLYEKYADDFGPDHPHTIMSITKTIMNLVLGELIRDGKIDPSHPVSHYLPEVGSGYAEATVQQVMNMDMENEYSEDYADPNSSSYFHEVALGWRLGMEGISDKQGQRDFLKTIKSDDVANKTGYANYKSANTDLLAWLAEEVGEKSMHEWLIDITEAAGLEHAFNMTTDRTGFPTIDGGGCLTARDLCRFGLLFARSGKGVDGRKIGDAEFIQLTRDNPGPGFEDDPDYVKYSNQMFTNGVWLGHAGWGGQFMLANPDTGAVGVFFSVLENASAWDPVYKMRIIKMLDHITANFDVE